MLKRIHALDRDRVCLGLIAAAALLRFVNLGFDDVQAWDEALYAIRAEAALRFGAWADQTPYSIGGLYSSFHPPLFIWLTSLVYALAGVTEFTTRVISALLGGATLLVIYRIGKKLGSAEVGLIAALLFGLNPFVSFHARQGQLDTTLVFFLTLGMLYALDAVGVRRVGGAVKSGLAAGAALMSKAFVGFGIPLVFLVGFLGARQHRRADRWLEFLMITVIGVVIALPWHISMTLKHGGGDPFFFVKAADLFDRAVTGFEGNVKQLGVFYFVNQLFVLFPLGVAWAAHGLLRVLRTNDARWQLIGAWFLVFFVVFSAARSKLAVYLLPTLVPASLLGAQAIRASDPENAEASSRVSSRAFWSLLGVTLFSILWSAHQGWRTAVKEVGLSILSLEIPAADVFFLFGQFFLLTLVGAAVLWATWKLKAEERLRQSLPYLLLVPSFAWLAYSAAVLDSTRYNDGAAQLSDLIDEQGYVRIVAVGFDHNPQLTYYLAGVDLGWRDDLSLRRIVPPVERKRIRTWLANELAGEPDHALVVIEKDKLVRFEVMPADEIVPPDYSIVFESRRYLALERLLPFEYAQHSPLQLEDPEARPGRSVSHHHNISSRWWH